jgi:hypothetical protein
MNNSGLIAANQRRKLEAAALHATPEHIERGKLYWVWAEMISRCTNPNHRQFRDYGGRGISVCSTWRQSFDAFLADLGPRPTGLLLDRIDNNGNYEAANCKWSTRKEQNSNRRNCIYLEIDGAKVTLREACRIKGISYRPIVKRIWKGWSPLEALSVPLNCRRTA